MVINIRNSSEIYHLKTVLIGHKYVKPQTNKMKAHYLVIIFIIFEKGLSYKPSHQIDRQIKKQCKESFTPARYKVGVKNFNYDLPTDEKVMEYYFPDVEYPTNILETSKPFFYKIGENNAMLGPFPEDVKSSYKALVENNKKSIEELKTKYINELGLNAKNCVQENTEPTPKENKIAKENIAEVKENDDDVLVTDTDDISNDEVTQNEEVPDAEDFASEELESNYSSSESDETVEDMEEHEEISEVENEEEEYSEACFQSCENGQYYSDDITEQLLEAEYMGSENQTVSDVDALEQTENTSAFMDSLEPLADFSNVEEQLCSAPEPDKQDDTFDISKLLDCKLRQTFKKSKLMNSQNNKPLGFKRNPCKKL